jgi:uncharacterized protein (TIGR03067 family)
MNGDFEFDLPTVMDGPSKLVFTGEQFTFMNDERLPRRVHGTFSCDERKRPKEIAFHYADRRVVGIYSLAGSNLKVCFGKDDLVPPTMFAGGPWERPALIEFRRPRPR